MNPIAVLAVILASASCTAADAPVVDARVPCRLVRSNQIVIAAAQTAPTCRYLVNGVPFVVGSLDGQTVAYVSTTNSDFRTPEGVHVRSVLGDIAETGGSPVRSEAGWRYFSRLPSGWCAVVEGIPDSASNEPSKDAPVVELFIRR
jgi:hypothetical protein